MKKTIKKILKEETEGNNFTIFELKLLNWLYDTLNGKHINIVYKHGGNKFGEFIHNLKKLFGLTNKKIAEIISLYDDNLTGKRFTQRNDVIRNKVYKWRVSYSRDVSAWVIDDYVVYSDSEDNAIKMVDTEISNYLFDDKFIESIHPGDVETGNFGDIFDTQADIMSESIKKQLDLLKDSLK